MLNAVLVRKKVYIILDDIMNNAMGASTIKQASIGKIPSSFWVLDIVHCILTISYDLLLPIL